MPPFGYKPYYEQQPQGLLPQQGPQAGAPLPAAGGGGVAAAARPKKRRSPSRRCVRYAKGTRAHCAKWKWDKDAQGKYFRVCESKVAGSRGKCLRYKYTKRSRGAVGRDASGRFIRGGGAGGRVVHRKSSLGRRCVRRSKAVRAHCGKFKCEFITDPQTGVISRKCVCEKKVARRPGKCLSYRRPRRSYSARPRSRSVARYAYYPKKRRSAHKKNISTRRRMTSRYSHALAPRRRTHRVCRRYAGNASGALCRTYRRKRCRTVRKGVCVKYYPYHCKSHYSRKHCVGYGLAPLRRRRRVRHDSELVPHRRRRRTTRLTTHRRRRHALAVVTHHRKRRHTLAVVHHHRKRRRTCAHFVGTAGARRCRRFGARKCVKYNSTGTCRRKARRCTSHYSRRHCVTWHRASPARRRKTYRYY